MRPCRRALRCVAEPIACVREPSQPTDDSNRAEIMAELRRALRQRMAEHGWDDR